MLIKLAWRNLWRNRRRTFITMASIIFAVLLAVSLNSVKEGVLERMQENVVSFYTGAVQVHQQGYWDDKTIDDTFVLSDSLIQDILAHEEVTAAIPRLESFALAASDEYSKGCMVVGFDPAAEPLVTRLDEKLVEGQYLEMEDRAVLLYEG